MWALQSTKGGLRRGRIWGEVRGKTKHHVKRGVICLLSDGYRRDATSCEVSHTPEDPPDQGTIEKTPRIIEEKF